MPDQKRIEQQFLKFSIDSSSRLYPDVFRELVSKHAPDNHAFFHYVSSTQTAQGKPPTRFIGGTRWVGVVTDDHNGLSTDMTLPCIEAFNDPRAKAHIGEAGVGVELLRKTKSCFVTDEPRLYSMAKGIDRRKAVKRGEVSDENQFRHLIMAMVEDAVRQGLLDIMPTDDELDITPVGNITPWTLTSQFSNGGKQAIRNLSGQFTMNLDLKGIWQTGSFTSRGHGLIYKANKAGVFQLC